jgi:hypothetical protein
MHVRFSASMALFLMGVGLAVGGVVLSCVPAGSAGPQDSGATSAKPTEPTPAANRETPASGDVMKTPFEDDFSRVGSPPLVAAAAPEAGSTGDGAAPASTGPEPNPADWFVTQPGIWHIEGGKLCGEHGKNHGIWLKRVLPVNARIEFDAVAQSTDGDLKAEYWGDGRSYATSLSYTNATSYLTIFGGWHNKTHVLARLNEHGTDRKEITTDPNSDDIREKPVNAGQIYHFKVERTDGKTIKWYINGDEMLTWADTAPLSGAGHDHFGFNDWDLKVCFDNVKVVPLP